MSLYYDEKIKILDSLGMEKYFIKPNKTNYRYKGKVIVREMREGSIVAYVWGRGFSSKYKYDARGWIHIHDFTEDQIRELINEVKAHQDKIAIFNNKDGR
ncbi:hypothetical protein ACQCVB_04965 [Fictibacillus phosphorivorans]|uniref:hypothetical protein n=1 Tax=Fictibacillus phosphorivorans TaxID=1221500 RepID=UPI003CE82EB9